MSSTRQSSSGSIRGAAAAAAPPRPKKYFGERPAAAEMPRPQVVAPTTRGTGSRSPKRLRNRQASQQPLPPTSSASTACLKPNELELAAAGSSGAAGPKRPRTAAARAAPASAPANVASRGTSSQGRAGPAGAVTPSDATTAAAGLAVSMGAREYQEDRATVLPDLAPLG